MCVTQCVIVVTRSDDDWLTGEVRAEGHPTQPFVGWVSLLSALETVIRGGDRNR